ncbi:MAG: hypothetical protein E6H77_14880 [Betaproteobacteria bacterium]|nr:MAG: hypothetical protein E6H77_14880 [Betaproteobacteria bacterium]
MCAPNRRATPNFYRSSTLANEGVSGAQALLRALRAMGVERIFASPGSDWAPLWEALAAPWKSGEVPEYISSRHEETALGMASGYAKATGKLPALVLHTTVGALHAAMGLRAALRAARRAAVAARADRCRRTGGARRSQRQVELCSQHEPDPATYPPARLPARDERAEGAGIRLGADRDADGDDERRAADCRHARIHGGERRRDRRARRSARRGEEAGDRHRGARPRSGGRGRARARRRSARRAGARWLACRLRQLPARPCAVRGRRARAAASAPQGG